MFVAEDKVALGARLWVEKAENDLAAAAVIIKAKHPGTAEAVCFHAQQCVEKYLKAVLAWRRIDFPRTHNVDRLVTLLPVNDRPALSQAEQTQLTTYAADVRYPGDYAPVSLTEARQAVKLARRVRKQIRARLPKQALRTRAAD
jgi:HEPN domain-containing protein